jgi:hypothetical protein
MMIDWLSILTSAIGATAIVITALVVCLVFAGGP